MSRKTQPDTALAITTRMDAQRAQLHRQFAPPEEPVVAEAMASDLRGAMQPHEYRSLTMRLLVANPQLVQRVLLFAATTALGARYGAWPMRLIGWWLASRRASRA